MNFTKIADLAFKLMGLSFISDLIPFWATTVNIFSFSEGSLSPINSVEKASYLIILLLYFLFSYMLLFKTRIILKVLGINDSESNEDSQIAFSYKNILRLIIILFGVYLISLKFGYLCITIFQYFSVRPELSEFSNTLVKNIFINLFPMVVGILFILYSSKLVNIFLGNKTEI